MQKVLLSILIPTYNREKYLKKALESIEISIEKNLNSKIEILVSDNNSIDQTQKLLDSFKGKFLSKNIKFRYWKNEKNLGFDGNFSKLFLESSGEFCWIFGDDEYLLPRKLEKIIKVLEENKNMGLLHIKNTSEKKEERKYTKEESCKYIKEVNYMISFITANIFNKKYVETNMNVSDFIGSNLIQELYYFQSIYNSEFNLILLEKIFSTDQAKNGGNYKLFKTFGTEQNKIFEFFKQYGLEQKSIEIINQKMLTKFFPNYILKNDDKWVDENIRIELEKNYRCYKEYWIFCYPLIKLPKKISKLYLVIIKLFNKIFDYKERYYG